MANETVVVVTGDPSALGLLRPGQPRGKGMIMALKAVTHRIGSWEFPADAESIRATVFGHMVKLAMPVVKHYVSDLYHDAGWIREKMTGDDFAFVYAVRESGTMIGDSTEHARAFRDDTAKAWEVYFTRERYFLSVTFSPIY